MIGKKKISILLALVAIGACVTSCGTSKNEVKKIGIVQYIQHTALDSANKGFIEGLKEKGYEEGKNIEIDNENAQGKIDVAQQICGQFVSSNKDLIFSIATPTAQAALNSTKKIPIVFTAVTDPVEAGLVKSLNSPDGNVTGTSDKVNIDEQLSLFKKLVPNAKKMGVIYTTSEINSINQVEELKELAPKYGLEIKEIGIANINEVNQNLNNAIRDIDCLYAPTDNLVAASYSLVGSICTSNNIPSIGAEPAIVEQGGLVSKGIDYEELGKMAGNKAAEILDGKDPSDIEVESMNELKITINEDVAKKLNITIPEDIKEKATLITGGIK